MALVLFLACCLTTASLTSPTRDRRPVLTNRLPLAFEANEGQVDPRVKFLARGSGYTVFLAATEMVLSLRGKSADSATEPKVAELVKLRYFAGLTIPQAAAQLQISPRTADAWWSYAKAWFQLPRPRITQLWV